MRIIANSDEFCNFRFVFIIKSTGLCVYIQTLSIQFLAIQQTTKVDTPSDHLLLESSSVFITILYTLFSLTAKVYLYHIYAKWAKENYAFLLCVVYSSKRK